MAALAEYRANHPELSEEKAKVAFYEDQLVALYAKLYAATKALDSRLIVLSHVLPHYRPNLYYGRRIKADYGAMTVSWFFHMITQLTAREKREFARKLMADRTDS